MLEVKLLDIIDSYKRYLNTKLGTNDHTQLDQMQFYTKDSALNEYQIKLADGVVYVRFAPAGERMPILKDR